jgi:hypothetical protein
MTLPKLKLVGLTVNPAWTPVPDNAIVAGEPVALLVTVTLPLALPLVVGA